MSPEAITIFMFVTMMVLLMTGQRVFGIIGFVGLIAPHIARQLVGPKHLYCLPASGLVGALLLLIADDLARTLAAPMELPVGVLTALLGGPFFLYLLKRRQAPLGAPA